MSRNYQPTTPYERNILADTLATRNPDYAKRVEVLAPRPPKGHELRGLFECVARNNKLRREREERRKFDQDLGL